MSEEAEVAGASELAAAAAASNLVAALRDGGVSVTSDSAVASMALAAAAAVGLVADLGPDAEDDGELGDSVSEAAAAAAGIDDEDFDEEEDDPDDPEEAADPEQQVDPEKVCADQAGKGEDAEDPDGVVSSDGVPVVPPVTEPSMSCDNVPDFGVLCSFLDRFGPLLGITPSIKEVQIMLEQHGNGKAGLRGRGRVGLWGFIGREYVLLLLESVRACGVMF